MGGSFSVSGSAGPDTEVGGVVPTPTAKHDGFEGDLASSRSLRYGATSVVDDGGARPLSARRVKVRLMLGDVVAALVGIAVAIAVQRIVRPVPSWIVSGQLLFVVASIPAFALGAARNRIYQARTTERPAEEARRLLNTIAVGMGLMVTLAFAVQYDQMSRLWVILLSASLYASLLVERRIARRVFHRLRLSGRLTRRIIVVGTDAHAIGLMHTYDRNPGLGYRVVGFVGDDALAERNGIPVLGPLEDLEAILERHEVSSVVVSLASVGTDEVNLLTRRLTDNGCHVALSSSLTDIDVTRLRPQQLDGTTMLYVEPVIRDGWRAHAKRIFDVTMAATILTLTLPLLLLAMLAIRLDSPGPVFFRQVRVGRNGRLFTMTKLRTMVVDAEVQKAELAELNEADGPLFKMEHDPRVTRVGRVLRKLSIDELPQLFAVLRGTMSMVGPRPALPEEAQQWDGGLADRLRVLPGLTGLWQISGRSDAGFDQYRRLDLYYVDNWSLAHDVRICARTVGVVLTGRGAA